MHNMHAKVSQWCSSWAEFKDGQFCIRMKRALCTLTIIRFKGRGILDVRSVGKRDSSGTGRERKVREGMLAIKNDAYPKAKSPFVTEFCANADARGKLLISAYRE